MRSVLPFQNPDPFGNGRIGRRDDQVGRVKSANFDEGVAEVGIIVVLGPKAAVPETRLRRWVADSSEHSAFELFNGTHKASRRRTVTDENRHWLASGDERRTNHLNVGRIPDDVRPD